VLHELVRQMAAEKLAVLPALSLPVGDQASLAGRHASYYLRLLAAAEGELVGPTLHRSTARLRAEIDNLRLAWRWAVGAQEWPLLREALPALALFFDLTGLMPELRHLLADAAAALEQATPLPLDEWPAASRRLLAGLDVYALDALRMTGDAGVAVAQAQRALHGAEAVGDLALQIQAHNKYAGLLYRTGQKQESLHYHRLSLQLAHQFGDARWIAICQMSLGDALVYLGDAEAGTWLHAALATQRRILDRRAEGWTLNTLGVFYYFQGDARAAQRCYEEALTIFRELGDQSREGKVTNNLANILASANDFSGAERNFRRALHLARETGDRDSELFATANLGDCYRSLGRFVEAREWLTRAGYLARQLDHKRSQSYLNGMLAQLEEQSGDYEAARRYLVEAVRIAEETDEHLSRLNLLSRLCALCWTMGQLERALAAAQDQEQVAQSIGDKALLCNGLLAQAHLQQILGNTAALMAVGERLRQIGEDDSVPMLQMQALAAWHHMQSEWAPRRPLPAALAESISRGHGGEEPEAIARTYVMTQVGWHYLAAGELARAQPYFAAALAGAFDASDPRTGRWPAVIGAAKTALCTNELERCRPLVQEVAEHWLARGAAGFPDPPAAWQLLAAAVAHAALPAHAAWMPGMLATAMQPLLQQMTDPTLRQHFLHRLARIDGHELSTD
jgi:tetratricopeptide (TPR) repeat protein